MDAGLKVSGIITEREAEVLLAVAEADDLEAAAVDLNVSVQTVRTATWRLRRKLGVKTNLQAYRKLTAGVRFNVTRETTRTITTVSAVDVRLEGSDDQ